MTIIEFREKKLLIKPVNKIMRIKRRNDAWLTTWPNQFISGGLFHFVEVNAQLEKIIIKASLCGKSKHVICLG